MISEMSTMFSRMIGTLAVLLLISVFMGLSNISEKFKRMNITWLYPVVMGIIGGAFGIYGNIAGIDLNGAIISVRDIGPMFAGITGGPLGGLIAGLIAGLHRLTIGGITAQACVVATCCIGLICGFVSMKWYRLIVKPLFAFVLSVLMEAFHLSLVLLMVKPFETALDIVRQIAIPFIVVNAFGFMIMIAIITFTENQHKLVLDRNRMQSELAVANTIQHSLLPLINIDYPGCKELEISASMEAAKEVGGDFYDVFYVGSDQLAFVIGDVSGKGVPAALFMASSKITLQNCIRDIPNLSEAVSAANNALCTRNDAEMFVTIWVGIINLTDGTLRFVSAGHNPPALLRDNKAEFLKYKNGFVVGGMENMRYKEHTVQLQKGDVVYLYTDGVTEAEDKLHNLYGEERLLRCFNNKSDSTPSEIIKTIREDVELFVNGNSQFDDMTMLCFKWSKDS